MISTPPRGMAESMQGLIFSPTKNLNLAHGTSTANELMRKLIYNPLAPKREIPYHEL